jgi:hypothetical protein
MELKVGMSGPLVYTVQEQLNDRIASSRARPLVLNGKFDAAMQARVKMFQDEWNLAPTGVVDDITSTVLLRDFFEYEFMPRPIVVLQNTNHFHCWAASLSSWSQTNARVPAMSVWEALNEFKKVRGALDPENEGITTVGWTAVARRFQMHAAVYGGSKGTDPDKLTIDLIFRLIKSHGPILIAFNLPETDGTIAHTYVAYGVYIRLNAGDQKKEGYAVWVMDPWKVGRTPARLEYIRSSGEILVLWR